MANPLGDPIPVGESTTEDTTQTREHGECPDCSGRARSTGESNGKEFFMCECGNSFTETWE